MHILNKLSNEYRINLLINVPYVNMTPGVTHQHSYDIFNVTGMLYEESKRVELSPCLTKHYVMKTQRNGSIDPCFLTSVLV